MTSSQPKTGDVFLADLNPVRGSEQGKERPVIAFFMVDCHDPCNQ